MRTIDRLEPYRPGVDGPFDFDEAAHLARRAAFGAPVEVIERWTADGLGRALDELFSMPAESPRALEAEEMSARAAARGDADGVRSAWVMRLAHTRRPLVERMALVWHGHFATAIAKVGDAALMHDQIEIFRRKGLGDFRDLVHAVAKDPAMMRWLDVDASDKTSPNENFSRELMELFTLGRGHYTERDIREAARAFTGWTIKSGRFHFDASKHDAGPKSLFGRGAVVRGEDVVDLCLDRKESARFVARRLFTAFAGPDVNDELCQALGARFEACGRNVAAFLRMVLESRAFFAPENRHRMFRSPAAFAAGALRAVGAVFDYAEAARRMTDMGQELLNPPSVKGWDEGRGWITTATLAARRRFAAECGRGETGALFVRIPLEVDPRRLRRALLGPPEEESAKDDAVPCPGLFAHVMTEERYQLF